MENLRSPDWLLVFKGRHPWIDFCYMGVGNILSTFLSAIIIKIIFFWTMKIVMANKHV